MLNSTSLIDLVATGAIAFVVIYSVALLFFRGRPGKHKAAMMVAGALVAIGLVGGLIRL